MITIGVITAFIAGLISGYLIRYWKQIVTVLLLILAVAAFAVLRMSKRGIEIINENGGRDTSGSHPMDDDEIDELVSEGVITWEEGQKMKRGGTVSKRVSS